jgi:hypothetical protein
MTYSIAIAIFCLIKVREKNGEIMYIQFLQNFSLSSNSISESMVAYIQYGFSSAVPALKYLFPLSVSFFKG